MAKRRKPLIFLTFFDIICTDNKEALMVKSEHPCAISLNDLLLQTVSVWLL